MLRELKVTDYAIIDDLAVRFDPGLNIFTGETGAGKSIIVGALSFTLGERVSEDVIRKGQAACRVEAVFDSASGGAKAGTDEITLSREIARDGRSKCMANGKAISLAALRELGNSLVDFHGQHEHQVILNVASHVDFLDDFGGLHAARTDLAAKRRAFIETSKRLAGLRRAIDDVRTKEEFIRHEIREIEGLDLKANEDARIEEETIRFLYLFEPISREEQDARAKEREEARRKALREQNLVYSAGDSTPAAPAKRETAKAGRNDPCPCGSGKKFKKCHGK